MSILRYQKLNKTIERSEVNEEFLFMSAVVDVVYCIEE